MTDAVIRIKQWGNSLGILLPSAIARAAHLRADQPVRVSVEGNQVVISPMTNPHLSLEQRLAAYDPARHVGKVFRSV
jgi:antitoxin MazE